MYLMQHIQPPFKNFMINTKRIAYKSDLLRGGQRSPKRSIETAKLGEIKAAAKLVKKLQDKGVSCVIVHGAGSFGHHQAKKYGVNKGYSGVPGGDKATTMIGFCLTRVSVTKLNHLVTECLVKEGVPAVGIQACGTWKTDSKKVMEDGLQAVDDLLNNGYVPVLHGDCVLDKSQGCCILSGDTIVMKLCEVYSPRKVVFFTDVDGVYVKPPSLPGAKLLQTIKVDQTGKYDATITTSVDQNDVTGGIRMKLDSAINITINSKGRIPVIICNISGDAAESLCLHNSKPDNATFIEYAH